jgi:hypothetical protein
MVWIERINVVDASVAVAEAWAWVAPHAGAIGTTGDEMSTQTEL